MENKNKADDILGQIEGFLAPEDAQPTESQQPGSNEHQQPSPEQPGTQQATSPQPGQVAGTEPPLPSELAAQSDSTNQMLDQLAVLQQLQQMQELQRLQQLQQMQQMQQMQTPTQQQMFQNLQMQQMPQATPNAVQTTLDLINQGAPNIPKPPEDFEPYEMLNPNTESGKYFLNVLNQVTQQTILPTVQQQQQQLAEQIEMMRLEMMAKQAEEWEYKNFLATRRDIDPNEAQQFWEWAKSPANVTIDTLYEVYKVLNSKNASPEQKQAAGDVKHLINEIKQSKQAPPVEPNNSSGDSSEGGFGKALLDSGDFWY